MKLKSIYLLLCFKLKRRDIGALFQISECSSTVQVPMSTTTTKSIQDRPRVRNLVMKQLLQSVASETWEMYFCKYYTQWHATWCNKLLDPNLMWRYTLNHGWRDVSWLDITSPVAAQVMSRLAGVLRSITEQKI